MKFKVQWAGCSDLPERAKTLNEKHKEFELSSLKKKIEEGYTVTQVKKRRPRIYHGPEPRMMAVKVFGKETVVSIAVYKKYYEPEGFKKIRIIY